MASKCKPGRRAAKRMRKRVAAEREAMLGRFRNDIYRHQLRRAGKDNGLDTEEGFNLALTKAIAGPELAALTGHDELRKALVTADPKDFAKKAEELVDLDLALRLAGVNPRAKSKDVQ